MSRLGKKFTESSFGVLVTVVDIKGSTYRRPGARLLIVDDVGYGSISGGCLESELFRTALAKTYEGATVETFDTTSDVDAVWGYGLGCRGIVTVILRRINRLDPEMELLSQHLTSRQTSSLAVSMNESNMGEMLFQDENVAPLIDLLPPGSSAGVVKTDRSSYFVQSIDPPISLNVFGAGFDAIPLAQISSIIGWVVSVFDQRSAMLTEERFPDADKLVCKRFNELDPPCDEFTACVVMSHSYEQDRIILSKLLSANLRYLGVLGPHARTERLLEDLGCPDQITRIYSPVGLDLGAETPQEIALAIVAEIQTVFSQRNGGFLKDKPRSLHSQLSLK